MSAATALGITGLVAPVGAATDVAKKPPGPRHVAFASWTSDDFSVGTFAGTGPDANGDLVMAQPVGKTTYTDPFGDGTARTYDYGTWTSPTVRPGFDLTELVASWNAETPGGTWLQVEMHGTDPSGATSKWYVMGRWAAEDTSLYRTSVPGQGDETGSVAVDTFVAGTAQYLSDWQLRLTLYRPPGSDQSPAVSLAGAMASALPDAKSVPASALGGAEGVTLDVPAYSQEVHRGEYPQWDNGGEAWCSPTSIAMVIAYWGTGPTAADMSWVDPAYEDPQVDYAARNVFDYNYDGAGNWPFNTAYAGGYGLESFVTRLRSLNEAEQFVKAGIPLVVSVSFKKSELDGAGYGTNGHLLVIVGFTEGGDVVVNDPASHLLASDAAVRTVYDREQFENVWIPHSGGIAYVIHPAGVPLPPAPPSEPNW